MVNSFGVPSLDPDIWMPDVQEALRYFGFGKLLIVSVMGSYEICRTDEELIEDFVRVAKNAENTGVKVIELNLSCPNIMNSDPLKRNNYCDDEKIFRIVEKVRNSLKNDTNLLIKLGYLDENNMRKTIIPLIKGKFIDGVTGINTMPIKAYNDNRTPAFPAPEGRNYDARLKAGLSGVAIKNFGLDFVKKLINIRQDIGENFCILGVGGIMNKYDFKEYLDSGSDIAMSATAANDKADLAMETKKFLNDFEDRKKYLA